MSPALPASLWAGVTPPGPAYPALMGRERAGVVVVGAGFTGLSAALHLVEAGHEVAVVEAAEVGWGASGRNNGQVIPTLTGPDPDDIERRWGDAGERFVRLLRDSADLLFDTVRRLGLEAEAEQTGWVQPAHSPGRVRVSERRARQWERRGAPVALLSRDEIRAMTGSEVWHGGFWNRSGGHVNPLALVRGLAGAVTAAGGRIFARSPASDVAREGAGWIVRTSAGSLEAPALVLATNAYTGEFSRRLAPEVARGVVPVLSWQMATRPLGEEVRARVIPGRQAVSDTHGDLYFARWDARGRLVTGGALVNSVNGAERLKTRIGARLKRVFPALGEVAFDHVWSGHIGMTRDRAPLIQRLGPDGYAFAGCNGRAVALSLAIGREFARAIGGAPERDLALPFSAPAPWPLHRVTRTLAPLALLLYRHRDGREVAP